MNSKITKILVLGETGNGKSTFCNYILGEKKCKESEKSVSETFDVTGYPCSENSKNSDILVIDTPGLADSKGRDQEVINKIKKRLSEEHCNGIKSIIIMVNVNIPRLSQEAQRQITIYCKMFPHPEFWYHVAIAFSFCYEYFPEEQLKYIKEQKNGDFINHFKQVVDELTNEMNKNLSSDKQIKVPGLFQTYYLDCGKVYPPFTHKRTDEQINSLLTWSRNNEYLDFDKNDLKGQVFADYKDCQPIEDKKDFNEENDAGNQETKCITKYFKQYRVTDFHNKSDILNDKEPYKTEIYYLQIEIREEKETSYDKVADDKEKKNEITQIRRFKRIKKLDANHQFIEYKGDEEEIKGDRIENLMPSTIKEIYTEDKTEDRVLYDTITNYEDSPTGVQKYFENIKKQSTGQKILFIGFNIVHFVAGLGHLIAFIVSKLQKKQRWKIVKRIYKKIKYEREIKINDLGYKFEGEWKEKEVLDTWEEYNEPIRID